MLLFDAAGLGLFAVAGTQKALAIGIHSLVSALLGMLTGIGGGVLRDLLVDEIPVVVRADLYALAALAGAAVVVGGHLDGWPPTRTTIGGRPPVFRPTARRDSPRMEPAACSATGLFVTRVSIAEIARAATCIYVEGIEANRAFESSGFHLTVVKIAEPRDHLGVTVEPFTRDPRRTDDD